jgi:hypothetical protein
MEEICFMMGRILEIIFHPNLKKRDIPPLRIALHSDTSEGSQTATPSRLGDVAYTSPYRRP